MISRLGYAVLACLLLVGVAAPTAAGTDEPRPQPQAGARGRTEPNAAITARSAAAGSSRRQAHVTRRRPRPEANPDAPRTATAAGAERSPIRAAPQTVGTNFLGAQFIDDSDFVPPDSMGAVGPTQFLVSINGRIRTFTKAGTADGVLDSTLDNFFASVGGLTNGTTDPRVRYDRHSSRWFVTAMDIPPDVPNHILIAVSGGPVMTASSTWTFFSIPAAADVAFDFPTLGVDEDALYIGTNVFGATAPFDFVNTAAFVVRKSSVIESGPIVFTEFADLINTSTGEGLWSPMGVDNFDAETTEGYFIGVDFAQFGRIVFRRITDPGGTPSISSTLGVGVPTTTFPIPVPQPGALPPLDGLDDRLSNGVIRNGLLSTSQAIEVNRSGSGQVGGGRDGVRWYEFQNLGTAPIRRQSGTIWDAASLDPFSYWMPSVMVSGQGHAAFGFSQASVDATSGFASAAMAGRLATDSLNFQGSPTLIQGSTFGYETDITTPERWGDYSYTSLDPNDDMTMWTIQEYASATDKWGVRIAQLKAPAPTVSSGGFAQVGQTSAPVAVKGAGFFEPGAAFPNHLTASIEGGPTVNSITSVSPTRVDLDVSTLGVPAGSYDITITNPDGQSATGTLFVSLNAVAHDLAVIKIGAVKPLEFSGVLVKTIPVSIQNRSGHPETIPDRATLANLIHLNVDSLSESTCPDAEVILAGKQKTLPITLKSKKKLTAYFIVDFNCVVDPEKSTDDNPGHQDFTMSASVHHDALDGENDTHTSDDVCPYSVPPPYEIDLNPDGSIKDRGCGAKKPDGTFGGPMFVDLYVK